MSKAAEILGSVAMVADDSEPGLVSAEALPYEEARALEARLTAAGHEASVARDNDDRSMAWLYVRGA